MGNDTAPTQHDTAGDHVVPSAGRPPSPVEQPLPGAAAGVSLPNTTRLGPYPGARSPHRGAEDDVDEAMRAMVATAMPAAAARVSASVDSLAGAHGTDPHGIAAADGPRALSASSGDLLLSHAELSGAVSASLLATVAGDLGPASRGAPADDHGQDERTGRPEWRPRRQSASMSASKLSWRRPLPSNSPTRHRSTSMLSQQLARYEGIPERPAATLVLEEIPASSMLASPTTARPTTPTPRGAAPGRGSPSALPDPAPPPPPPRDGEPRQPTPGIPPQPPQQESPSFMGSLWEYVKGELTSSDFEESQDFKTERIRNFLSVPRELEKLLFFGYLICLDSFLYIFTILPLRMVIALWSMLGWCFGGPSLKPAQKTDLVKGALVGICSYLLQYFDASRLYHAVRGQALIKLYVIFNVLEICDKLCSAFGHDILDSLFSTSFPSRSAPVARRFSRITHFVVASMYIFAHSLVLFYQVMTLNVAVNSYNNALMTLLLSNQFVEIKGSVFKRFEKENLFQLSCADVVERFQLSVFLVIIATRNCIEIVGGNGDLSLPAFFAGLAARFTSLASLPSTVLVAVRALSSAPVDDLWALLSDTCTVLSTSISAILKSEEFKMLDVLLTPVLIVYATEILVDWLKHAFITKFNNISPSVYQRYNDSLCRDLLGARKTALPPQPAPQQYHPQQRSMIRDDTVADPMQMSAVDRSPIVARRIGFVSIPLACLVVRVGIQTFKMVLAQQSGYAEMQTPSVSALDAIDPDSPSEWSSSFAMPAWLSRTELDFTWTKHTVELYHYAAVGLVCYFILLVAKFLLGLSLVRMAKARLERAQSSAELERTAAAAQAAAPTLASTAAQPAASALSTMVDPAQTGPPPAQVGPDLAVTPAGSPSRFSQSAMFSPETPATPAASHGPHAPAHPASLFAQAIQNNVAAHQRASQLTSGLAAARDALAAAVLDADFEAPDTTPTRASAASAAPAPAVRIPEQTRVHSTDSLLTPIVIPAPSTPSLPLDAMSQSSARSSVLVATGTSADKKAAQAMPQSPSINEAKLDSLDRFTMVKSRIV